MKDCIIVIGSHADDHELNCGGTLAKYIAQGFEPLWVMLTCNACAAAPAGVDMTPRESGEIRNSEAAAAARVLGVRDEQMCFMHLQENQAGDGRFREHPGFGSYDWEAEDFPAEARERPHVLLAVQDEDTVEELATLIAQREPRIVITHPYKDPATEHCAATALTLTAFRRARERADVGTLYAWERVESLLPVAPDSFVDITDHIDAKIAALREHESQWSKGPYGFDGWEQHFRLRARYWGMHIGVQYAEAFQTLSKEGL